MKGRKSKKVQSAKIAGLKPLKRSNENHRKENVEWLRVLTPPGTGSSTADDANNVDSEDELIRRYFSGLSSAGSSISWAEDAVESEFTTKLVKLWEDIETVCAGEKRPNSMSDCVFDECLQWRKAFPNPDLHRFAKNDEIGEDLSSIESQTIEEGRGGGNAAFSPRSLGGGRKLNDEPINIGQLDFRRLNCSTPRPNIEKSTEYVSAWLSGCQNGYVPEKEQPLMEHRNSRSLSPLLPAINNGDHCGEKDISGNISNRHGARSSYTHYSRTHAKFVNEPDPTNFFTSLAITNNENYSNSRGKRSTSFLETSIGGGDGIQNISFGLPRFSSINDYRSKINESDEDDDDDYDVSETFSFRPNVRVQRPISSRIRDHTITPIATGSYAQPSFGRYQNDMNTNNQQTGSSTSASNPFGNEFYRSGGGRVRIFESFNGSTIPTSAKADGGTGVNRNKSGLARQGHSLTSQFGRSKQQPWSRHSGDDVD